jgi:hypothetical protein
MNTSGQHLARQTSPQGIRDAAIVQARIQRCSTLFNRMKTKLKDLTITYMLKLASTHPMIGAISSPDRIARRKKAALICWFCEYWPELVINSQELQTSQTHQEHQVPPINSQVQALVYSNEFSDEEFHWFDFDFN